MPPFNIEAEKAVLAAVLVDVDTALPLVEGLEAEEFYRIGHQLIFTAIMDVVAAGDAVDYVTVGEALREAGQLEKVGGLAYLSGLAEAVPTAANADHYAGIVKDLSARYSEHWDRLRDEEQADGRARPLLVRMADVEPEEVRWLWRPYLPLGKLALMDGDPGVGKTWLSLQLAANVTTGNPFPDADDPQGRPRGRREAANVLFMTAEDGLADTIRPRLDLAGADAGRFFVLDGWRLRDAETGEEREGSVTLAQLDVLREALAQVRPLLVVVDPLQGFLGRDVDMHRSNEVRPVMSGLGRLAEEYGCAVLTVRHLRKSSAGRVLYRGVGSIDFSAAVRSILLVGEDPEAPGRRAVVHIKSNLAPAGRSLGFTLDAGRFFWTGASELAAEDLLAADQGREERSAVDEAEEWLQAVLRAGPLQVAELKQEAQDAGHSWTGSVRRAADRLGVVKRERRKQEGTYGGWEWLLPPEQPGDRSPRVDHAQLDEEAAKPASKPFSPDEQEEKFAQLDESLLASHSEGAPPVEQDGSLGANRAAAQVDELGKWFQGQKGRSGRP